MDSNNNMKIEKFLFGKFEGQEIHLYELRNSKGMVVNIMNYGATITSIQVPGTDSFPVSLACGFDNFEGYFSKTYKDNSPYFGCTVGRYCSQIKNSGFELNGEYFRLVNNCGANSLHSEDMEEGFPGNVEASVMFVLNEANEILMEYNAAFQDSKMISLATA